MSDSLITKKAIAQCLKNLAAEKSFLKISIGDITAACGLNRQTFYYHFQDKYELLDWIYYEECFVPILDGITFDNWHLRIKQLLDTLKKEKVFYSNVIVTPDGRYYIIDWAHATQGNASADAARTYLTFTLSGQSDVAEKYLALFCKKADIPKQLVQQWMPIVACSESTKHIPGEREVLDRWVNVFDFQ